MFCLVLEQDPLQKVRLLTLRHWIDWSDHFNKFEEGNYQTPEEDHFGIKSPEVMTVNPCLCEQCLFETTDTMDDDLAAPLQTKNAGGNSSLSSFRNYWKSLGPM